MAVGTLRLIEAVRDHISHSGRPVRCYQAGSSEMFGAAPAPQSEGPRFTRGVPMASAKWRRIGLR